MEAEIAVIGGTGVYNPDMINDKKNIQIHTPYGKHSDIIIGNFKGKKVAFLFRHGKNHTIPPHKINFKANIWALKELGVKQIIGTAAVGSLKEEMKAGDMVIPDQFIDFGKEIYTFYDNEKVYHVSMANPFCPEIRESMIKIVRNLGFDYHEKGTYIRISGPQFSTKAASDMYRQFGDIIGMTCVPEAILSREMELCFACIATVTDYDCWKDKPVEMAEIKKVSKENNEKIVKIIEKIFNASFKRNCNCKYALKYASA